MELNDILEKLSLPQDLTRRGFLKAASAAAALGHLNDACAKTGVRPYVILETAKGLIIADPNLCVACHRCELACTEFNDGKATPRLARIKITRNVMFGPSGPTPFRPLSACTATASLFKTPAASARTRFPAPMPARRVLFRLTRRRAPAWLSRNAASAATSAKRLARGT